MHQIPAACAKQGKAGKAEDKGGAVHAAISFFKQVIIPLREEAGETRMRGQCGFAAWATASLRQMAVPFAGMLDCLKSFAK